MKKLSFENEPGSALTHSLGIVFSILALVLLLTKAISWGDAWHIVSFSIYGASLILMYLSSTTYHFLDRRRKSKEKLQIVDHASIFILIAGSYTPISLIVLRGLWGWTLFGVTWTVALIGVVLKIFFNKRIHPIPSSLLYIFLGWAGVFMISEMNNVLPIEGLFWLLIGGAMYTIGTVFFGLGKVWPFRTWFGYHEIFHIFVLAGSLAHFWFIWRYVVYIN